MSLSIEEEYNAALAEGPILVILPGHPIRGFKDMDAATLFVEAYQLASKTTEGEVLRIWLPDDKT